MVYEYYTPVEGTSLAFDSIEVWRTESWNMEQTTDYSSSLRDESSGGAVCVCYMYMTLDIFFFNGKGPWLLFRRSFRRRSAWRIKPLLKAR